MGALHSSAPFSIATIDFWRYGFRLERKETAVKLNGMSMKAIWCVLCAAGVAADLGASAAGQQANGMNGAWVNVDSATRGLAMIDVDGNKIHPYGTCHPQVCDWGLLKSKAFASDVNASEQGALRATMKTQFDKVEITVELEPDGRLRVETFTHFTDQSGRSDYREVGFFVRGRAPYTR
jgi:hypothetical protein